MMNTTECVLRLAAVFVEQRPDITMNQALATAARMGGGVPDAASYYLSTVTGSFSNEEFDGTPDAIAALQIAADLAR